MIPVTCIKKRKTMIFDSWQSKASSLVDCSKMANPQKKIMLDSGD